MKKLMKTMAVVLTAGSMMLAAGNADAGIRGTLLKNKKANYGIKNVIILIPDGCDATVMTLARWYKGEELQVDAMQGGGIKTHMANSVIPGSAAAATAFSSGHKTTVRFLGVGPRTEDLLTGFEPTAAPYAPVATILEGAKMQGKATGLVSTSRITHATPAAFACHIEDRGYDNEIMEHMVYNNLDVAFGGGARHLIPTGESYTTTFGASWSGKRTDGENLMEVLEDRGYQFVDNRHDLNNLTQGPVFGLFDDSHMQADIDRQYFAENEPSLAEMTDKAIELLSQDKDGFFLMVEGSQVDWAGHNNDQIWMVSDFIAFDDAVKVAVDFAKEDDHTLVLAYPDHNTGGMKIGHYTTPMPYTATTIEDLVNPLKGMTMTANGVVDMMADSSDDALKASVQENWGIDLSDDDVVEIRENIYGSSLSYALARVVSKNHTVIGWTTHGHNGETVPLWTYGASVPKGIIDNTELADIAADTLRVNLEQTTQSLFVDLNTVTSEYEIDWTDAENPVLMLAGAELPISKDYMIINGREIQLPGLTVLAPQGSGNADPSDDKVYVSKKALTTLGLM